MSGEATPSLRERNKARARAEIAHAALRLFGERGFEGVTVDQIVEAAGVSRRTFFRYFETKEDALLADYPELNIRLTETLGNSGHEDALEAVRAGLHRLADWYVDRSDAVLARSRVIRDGLHLSARNLEFMAQWERAIASVLAPRFEPGRADLLARTAGTAIVGAFKAALTQWVRSSCEEDLHALADRALDLIREGLASGMDQSPGGPSGAFGRQ
jgi:AcrR family transcriptional regulator